MGFDVHGRPFVPSQSARCAPTNPACRGDRLGRPFVPSHSARLSPTNPPVCPQPFRPFVPSHSARLSPVIPPVCSQAFRPFVPNHSARLPVLPVSPFARLPVCPFSPFAHFAHSPVYPQPFRPFQYFYFHNKIPNNHFKIFSKKSPAKKSTFLYNLHKKIAKNIENFVNNRPCTNIYIYIYT